MLKAPLQGWVGPLEEAPDPVFAQRLLGDGLAIDPTGSVLHAPCDGEVIHLSPRPAMPSACAPATGPRC